MINNFKVIGTYRKGDDKDFVIAVRKDGIQFINNGIYKWVCDDSRKSKLTEISADQFNKEKFLNNWNKYQGYSTIEF